MPQITPDTYAIFASQAYKDIGTALPKALEKAGWREIAVDPESFAHGYYGRAFFHEASQHMVLAHRGTEITSIRDLFNGAHIMLGYEAPQAQQAREFRSDAITALKKQAGCTLDKLSITDTGHSLGGYNALHSVASANTPDITSSHVAAVVFDPPTTQLPELQASITTYLASPNSINQAGGGKHQGVVRPIDALRQSKNQPVITHSMDAITQALVELKDTLSTDVRVAGVNADAPEVYCPLPVHNASKTTQNLVLS